MNSRHQKRKNHVWRRRRCSGCQSVFTTIELPDSGQALRVSTNGDLQPFSRDALLITVYDSLRHRKAALLSATALTDTIIARIYAINDSPIVERDLITELSGVVLESFDTAAATHYRAYHP